MYIYLFVLLVLLLLENLIIVFISLLILFGNIWSKIFLFNILYFKKLIVGFENIFKENCK